jgi:hypothetical protein
MKQKENIKSAVAAVKSSWRTINILVKIKPAEMVSTVSVSAAEMRRPKACNSSLLFLLLVKEEIIWLKKLIIAKNVIKQCSLISFMELIILRNILTAS